MSAPEHIRKAMDELSPSEQEDLLRYLAKRLDAAHGLEAQKLACEGRWLTEEESDLQYCIPESHQSTEISRREDD